MDCEHNWQFQNVVYSYGPQCPGSSARDRIYEDRYFCTKCLEVKDMKPRVVGNSYGSVVQGAMPK